MSHRATRVGSTSRWGTPFSPFVPGSLWTRNHELSARMSNQELAKKCASQLNYSNEAWSYDGKPAPSFYGYAGYGFNGLKPGFATTAAVVDQGLFIVPTTQPRVKVTLVNNKHEVEASPRAGLRELQKAFEAGPIPTLSKVPSGTLVGEGTDEPCCIICGDEMWDIWRLKWVEGIGWTFQYGAFVGPGSQVGYNGALGTWDGIYPPGFGGEVYGTRASGLADIGGLITLQDLVEVLRGKEDFGHALSLIIGTTPESGGLSYHLEPATKNDSTTDANSHEFLPNNLKAGEFSYTEKKLNGAYQTEDSGGRKGFFDGVPEGAHLVLNPAMHVGEFPAIAGKIAKACFRTLQRYGMVCTDRVGSGCIIAMESPGGLGSIYCTSVVNPIAGCEFGHYGGYSWGNGFSKVSEFVPSSWTDKSVATMVEEPTGEHSWVMNVFGSEAMRQLEVLEPYSS